MKNFINFLPKWVETNIQPAFYDKQSGTCIQQTARMYAKVNQLVRIANEQYETIASYIQQFTDLRNYVEDYFDNLNVQNEINAKLDQMADDGSLSAIIGDYVDNVVTPRIDAIDAEVDAQNATISGVVTQIQSVASGSPAGVYATKADLASADPNHSKIYLVTADGNWYYYSTDDSDWVAGGTYQGSTVSDSSVTISSLGLDTKATLSVSQPTITWVDNYYLEKSGDTVSKVSNNNFMYSDPFLVKAGKTVAVKYLSHSGTVNDMIKVICTCDSDGTNIRPKKHDPRTGVPTVTEWEVPADSYIIVSCKKSNFGGVWVYDTPVDQQELKGNETPTPAHHNLLLDVEAITSEAGSVVLTPTYTTDRKFPTVYHCEYDYTQGTAQYSWAYYAMFRRTIESVTASSVTFVVDVKSDDASQLSVFGRINNTTIPASEESFTIYDLSSQYKRYVYTFNFSSQAVTKVAIIFGERETFQDALGSQSGSFDVRLAGFSIGDNKSYLLHHPFTESDEAYQLDSDSGIKGLFGSFIKFGSIGDSLASGESVANNTGSNVYVDNNDFSWGQFMAREHGLTCYNYNKGGLTTRSWLTDSAGLPSLLESGDNCRAFIIGLGVNDANKIGTGYIGEPTDIKSDFTQNEDTFYGNYGRIISYCKQVQPKCKIFMYTIARVGSQYDAFNNAIRTIATMFDNVYLIDVDRSDYNTGFINDNLRSGHFNAIGYKAIADLMYKQLNNYMYNNASEFRQIEFIGTNYSWIS